MINSIKELNIVTLEKLINCIQSNNEMFVLSLGIEKMNNGFGTYFYELNNSVFNIISIHMERKNITEVNFSGIFNLFFSDIVDKYGEYRKEYSHYDETYFYFFNENIEEEASISCKLDYDIDKNKKKYIPINQLNIKYPAR